MSEHALSNRDGLLYGLLGLPLAFVALPLYVILPNHYAREFGVPLATLGAVLLAARLFDALIDPLLGRLSDRLFARSIHGVLVAGAHCRAVLAVGFSGLFFPPVREINALVVWAGVVLVLTYTAYSVLTIAHQSWGAMLGGDEAQRSRVVAWREGLGLVGVVLAAVAPASLGLPATRRCSRPAWRWAGWPGRGLAPCRKPPWGACHQPRRGHADAARCRQPCPSLWHPFARPAFRRLLAVFVLNGIASAVPATLVLFFVQDRLQAPPALEPVFLGTYFLCAALSMPLWLRGCGVSGWRAPGWPAWCWRWRCSSGPPHWARVMQCRS